jgi:hypothetical protein
MNNEEWNMSAIALMFFLFAYSISFSSPRGGREGVFCRRFYAG